MYGKPSCLLLAAATRFVTVCLEGHTLTMPHKVGCRGVGDSEALGGVGVYEGAVEVQGVTDCGHFLGPARVHKRKDVQLEAAGTCTVLISSLL